MICYLTRRAALGLCVATLLTLMIRSGLAGEAVPRPVVRFGVSTDLHLGKAVRGEEKLRLYVEAMKQWKPDFLVDLGDFACPSVYGRPRSYPEAHDDQLARLRTSWATLTEVPCPVYIAMGNHCVGWIRGGDERLQPADLQPGKHLGEDITKEEFLAVTKMPGRYYSFEQGGFHFIVLDPHNALPDEAAAGAARAEYFVDAAQRSWLVEDLQSHRDQYKVVFCHEEVLTTPKLPPPGGGDVPAWPSGPPRSDLANGADLQELFRNDGKVLACFQGHQHASGWTLHEGTCYLTLGELGSVRSRTGEEATYSKVALSDKRLLLEGVAKQRSYDIPLR